MKNKNEVQAVDQFDLAGAMQQIGHQNEIAEVIKELFDNTDDGKVFQITDLTAKQINIATRIWSYGNMKELPELNDFLTMFCKLQLSKNRQSRRETLDAIEGSNNRRGFWENTRMNPRNWGR